MGERGFSEQNIINVGSDNENEGVVSIRCVQVNAQFVNISVINILYVYVQLKGK